MTEETKERDWKPIRTMPDGVTALTCIIGIDGVRMEQELRRSGNLFFGGEVYVYYSPTHWDPDTAVLPAAIGTWR